MNRRERELFRVAAQIQQAIVKTVDQQPLPVLPESSWENALKWRGLWRTARERGWTRAAAECRDELRSALRVLIGQAQTAIEQLDDLGSNVPELPMRDVFEELVALQTEFEKVEWDRKQQRLTIITDSIELDDVYFGPFKVVLDWERLDGSKPYQVIAQDPQRAACDEAVTHPHVHGQQLCEGDGKTPIRHALQQGRLCDFFLLVRQILQTYNPSSAYVRIGEWDGKSCVDCGDVCERNDTSYCDNCNSNLCSACGASCAACDGLLCNECRGTCHGCHQTFCGECVSDCAGCGHSFCQECLTDGQCDKCRTANADSSDEGPATTPSAEPADAAFHAVGVGEVVVSA